MRLHVPDDDIHAIGPALLSRLKHGVGLADAGRHAEKDLEFAALRSRLLPGGLLILCDDLLERSPPLHGTEARWVERFRTGWHLSSLSTLTEVRQQAEAQGFRLQLAELEQK
jgi:hypothetical protein